jgi:hypothetical protein
VFAGGGTGGHGSTTDGSTFEKYIHFDSGVAAGVDDFAADDLGDDEVLHENGIN